MYRTTDGCKSWEKVYSSEYYGVDDIVFTNDLEGFALSDLKVLRTTDGGITWQDSGYIIPSNQIPVSIACNYENDLFVGSDRGGFFATINSKLITSTENNYVRTDVPQQYLLSQNYPNPFNPTTIINYSVPKQSNVILIIYDALGREVANLVNEEKPAGNYSIEFNAANLSSGIYFYQIRAGEFVQTKKMILLR
ncbi:MAG: T9SS type A sorting domain-containing protein [Ignavibacteria bacterium]|nr:T9SS type A sorting domain-containing protein [Ignavibacteria bacterium]